MATRWRWLQWSWWATLFLAAAVLMLIGSNIPGALAGSVLLINKVLFDTFVKPFPSVVTPSRIAKIGTLFSLFAFPVAVFALAFFVIDIPRVVLATAMPCGILFATLLMMLQKHRESSKSSGSAT